MACVDQVPGEEATPTPELDDKALARPHGFEQGEDAGRTQVGVSRVAQMVYEGEVPPVVGGLAVRHGNIIAARMKS